MKSRLGFVSNSSSSSYIIDIHRTLPEIIHEIDPPNSFHTHSLISILEQGIEKLKASLRENFSPTGAVGLFAKENYKFWIKEKSELLKLAKQYQKFPNKYEIDFIKKVFSINRIGIEENNGHTIFTTSSIIHNNFNDLGEILSAICLWYLFHRPDLIIAKEDSHND